MSPRIRVRHRLNIVLQMVTTPIPITIEVCPFMSTPDLNETSAVSAAQDAIYYPAHLPSGRPAMHYLKLHWSHGQADLVHQGFPAAFDFVDRALERGDGVLVQCVHIVFAKPYSTYLLTFFIVAANAVSLVPPHWLSRW